MHFWRCWTGRCRVPGTGRRARMGWWSANSRRKEACMDNFVMQSCVRVCVCVSLCVYCLHTAYICIYTCIYIYISQVCVCVCGGQDHSCMNKIFNIFLKFSFVYADYLSSTLFGAAATAVASRITSWLISSLFPCVCSCVCDVSSMHIFL